MHAISNANPAATATLPTNLRLREESRQADGKLKFCFSGAGSAAGKKSNANPAAAATRTNLRLREESRQADGAYYAAPDSRLNSGAIGPAAGRQISTAMTQARKDGCSIAAIGRKEGRHIAADIQRAEIQRKLTRQVRFSASTK